jgi:hypothetical protein
MTTTLGHLPAFALHRENINGADPAGVPANIADFRTRGYEKVALYIKTTAAGGNVDLEAWSYNLTENEWFVVWSQNNVPDKTIVEVPVYGGYTRIAARGLVGAASLNIYIGGAVPERPLAD